jgi:glucan 1,3-beta-glucosidase
VKDETRERRRRSSSSPTKPAAGGTPKKSSGTPKKGTPSKAKPKPVVVEEQDGSQTSLSADSLAKLDAYNTREIEKARKQEKEKVVTGRVVKDRSKKRKAGATGAATAASTGAAMLTEKNLHGREGTPRKNRDRVRAVANSIIDAGSNSIRRHRGGGKNHMDRPSNTSRRRKFLCLGALFVGVLLIILVPVGVLVVGKQNGGDDPDPSGPNNSNLGGISPDSIPQWAKGGPLDPFSWYDTQDFNLTFTNTSVGGLPIMGLNSTWDDSVAANDNVPPLNKPFGYGTRPIRGVNLGGWFSVEPFITPSMFNRYSSSENVVDEWTLCQKLGSTSAKSALEQHYSSFMNAQTFAEVRAAGFDHVRLPFSYWAVTTYPGDPYVAKVSWRYLLRAIEYARQNGIRVKLDLHALPGSQNGWNHSGRQGPIGWLNGTDGDLNGQRSLDLHDQLSKFFAQPRYANVIGIYGLVNEPKMISLPLEPVLNWTTHAIDTVRGNGLQQWIAVADGFLGLPKWQGQLSGEENVVLDAHQYVIFNTGQIGMDHTAKLNYACEGWTGQMQQSTNTATG